MASITLENPERLQDLSPAEHLLVWSLRAMAVGHGDCPALGQTFTRMCGDMGSAALQAQFTLAKLIGLGARRRLRLYTPGCLCVSLDETAMLGVVAAAQQALDDGPEGLLDMRLGFLVRPDMAPTVRLAALALGRVLQACGQDLPLRLEEALPRVAEAAPGLYAVH